MKSKCAPSVVMITFCPLKIRNATAANRDAINAQIEVMESSNVMSA